LDFSNDVFFNYLQRLIKLLIQLLDFTIYNPLPLTNSLNYKLIFKNMLDLVKLLIKLVIETSSPVLRNLLIDWLLSLFNHADAIAKQENNKTTP